MCRNIKPLFNFEPPATDEEIRAAALQFVRKISGFQKPSIENKKVFDDAINKISEDIKTLMDSLQTNSKPKNREEETAKARERSMKRFGKHL